MTVRTRYFVILSLLVVGVGLGTGLVAYYVGFPATALFGRDGPDELRFLPSSAAVVAYVDVRDVMGSELRQRFRRSVAPGEQESGQREFRNLTGIDIESDIDRVVACVSPGASGTSGNGDGVVVARGRFDEVKIEALMRDHGARISEYGGKRVIVADRIGLDANDANSPGRRPPAAPIPPGPANVEGFSLSFVEPGLVAIGTTNLVEHVVDLHNGGGASAATNDDLMSRVRPLSGGNVWAVGRLDVLKTATSLPSVVTSQLPPITWFTVRGRIDGGLQATLSAETRDDESAKNLREVVQGFLALARLQTSSRPEFKRFVDSLELTGTGKTVALSLDVPAQVFDALGALGGASGQASPKTPRGRQP